jgi:hypothetical protein
MTTSRSGHEESPLSDLAALRDRRFRELLAAVADGPGVLAPKVRAALVAGDAAPGAWTAFAAKVADGGLAVTDDEVAALAAEHGEDAVFECVVAVAVAAGRARLHAVEALLAESP